MEQVIGLALSNFTLIFLMFGAIAAAVSTARHGREHLPEAAIAHYCLFAIGITFLYNAVAHIFFGKAIAGFIGWADSPFQAEVGWASLGFAVVGFLAFKRGFDMRLAAVAGPACFLLGAAVGHIFQIINQHNYEPGNAGMILWTDILVPLLGAALLWWRYGTRAERATRAA